MSVYKRGKVWYLYIQVSGKRIQRAIPEARNKKQALEFQKSFRDAKKKNRISGGDRDSIPFSLSAKDYIDYVRKTLSPRSYQMASCDYDNHLEPFFRTVFINEINEPLLKQFQARQKSKGLGNRTVNIHIELVRKILNHSGLDIKIKYPRLKEPKKLHAFLTPAEFQAVMNCRNLESKNFSRRSQELSILALKRIRISSLCGLRPSEAAYLAWSDIDLNHKKLKIQSKPQQGWQVKDNEQRIIPLSDQAIEILNDIPRKSPWVFSPDKKPILSIRRSINTIASSCGISRHITPNQLRHTFATLSLQAGANPYAIKEIMGHQSLATTQKYLEALEESKIKAVNLLSTLTPHHIPTTPTKIITPKKKKSP